MSGDFQSGRGTARGMRGRGSGVYGGSRRFTQSISKYVWCYDILTRPEVDASDVDKKGIIPIYYRFASVYLIKGELSPMCLHIFALGFDSTSEPLDIPIHVSLVIDFLVVDWVH